ncbi:MULTISPECIES: hypothetical protein [Fischerella]|nr:MULTISPECIES: hypothetical protein [Fischerella]BAU05309.1 hypothetical protein FIS3754_12040 [Fischerella sp. NIES-3754]BCX07571.1 MAG: hypothetical protein KatS3mg066_1430 [Fischerella sp.]
MSGDVISEESQTIEDKSKEVAVDAPVLMDAHIEVTAHIVLE